MEHRLYLNLINQLIISFTILGSSTNLISKIESEEKTRFVTSDGEYGKGDSLKEFPQELSSNAKPKEREGKKNLNFLFIRA